LRPPNKSSNGWQVYVSLLLKPEMLEPNSDERRELINTRQSFESACDAPRSLSRLYGLVRKQWDRLSSSQFLRRRARRATAALAWSPQWRDGAEKS
jgi:hypothetical protein